MYTKQPLSVFVKYTLGALVGSVTSLRWFAALSVCHFRKEREATLSCSYQSNFSIRIVCKVSVHTFYELFKM